MRSLVLLSGLMSVFFHPNREKEIPFTDKTCKSFFYFFDSWKDMTGFFDFQKGETVADIGAGDGTYEGVISLWTDSLTFYAEDILPAHQRKFDKLIKQAAGIKGQANTNKFILCQGTERNTLLPDGIFDKILMISSFHEFTHKNEMLTDIRQKLKPSGKVYILETHCYTKTHINVTVDEVKTLMATNGFKLVKIQQPKTALTHLFVFEKK